MTKAPTPAKPDVIEIQCTAASVHLGDGRRLVKGEKAIVTGEIADIMLKSDKVKRV